MTALQTIGFIGLGAMGQAMAKNLLGAGFKVAGHDASEAAMSAVTEAGAVAYDCPRETAAAADLTITMLPKAEDVEAVLDGPKGVLASEGESRLLMNCSTNAPGDAKALASQAHAKGWHYIDCAVGRTATQAIEGKCLFLVAGTDGHKAAVTPVLEAMGDTIIDCGEVGQASALKMVNNYLALVSCLATAEALKLAEASNVTPDLALQVINGTTAKNGNTLLNYPNKVLKGDVTPGFSLLLGHKDLSIAVAAMKAAGVACFLGDQALDAFGEALARGHGSNDCTDILNALSEIQGEGQ